jgi:ribonuclease E
MLINAIPPEEVRIAILEDGTLEELYVERSTQESFVGNIYRGKIVNIEPSIQAAFVDFGVGRNGFLHVSDVDPQYYKHLQDGRQRKDGLLDVLDIPEISAEDEAALEASALADDEEEEVIEPVEVIEDESDQEVTLDDDEAPRESYRDRGDRGDRYRDGGGRGGRDSRGRGGRYGDRDRGPRDGGSRGRDRGDRQERGPRRYEDRPAPAPVQAAFTETQYTEATPPPPPQPRTVSEPVSSGSNFGFGILYEPSQESQPEQASFVSEPVSPPSYTQHEVTEPFSHQQPVFDQVTTGNSSFDMEDFSFRREETPPPPPVEPMPAAEHVTERPVSDFDFDVSFSAMKAPPPVQDDTNDVSFGNSDHSEEEGSTDEIPSFHAEPVETIPHFDRGEEPESAIPTFNREMVDEPISFDESNEVDMDEPPARTQRGDRRPRSGGNGRDGGRGRSGPPRGGFQRGGRPRMGGGRDFGRDGPNAPPKPPIQEIFRRGQEVLVQVIKEGIGTKGPTLSTYISIPGRYLVVMPGLSRIGVSRKIGDEQQRRRLKTILQDLEPPRGLGFIIRTAGLDRTRKELQRDLAYLTRLWRVIAARIKKGKGPAAIYQESDIITRTIRDIFTNQIEKIRVDEPVSHQHAHEFMQFVMPRYADRLVLEQGLEPLFHRFGIEEEIGNIQNKRVPLANGGSLVIDQTEALVAIDVNSGQFRQEKDAEENAYQMNLAAAKEVARQLRLRDLGGVIVIDFIDMRDERHRRDIERALRLAIGRDRARTKVLRMSQFGIIQMTRQRIRPSLKRTNFDECPACRATGLVKTGESMSIEVMRMLQLAAWRPNVSRVRIRVAETLAQFLLNRKRKEIARLEDEGKIQVTILGVPNALPETLEIQCLDDAGGEIRLTRPPMVKGKHQNHR